MSNQQKKYFLAPTWDNPPLVGQIGLGNIITRPKRPVPPILKATTVLDPSLVTQTELKEVEWSREKLRGGHFGIYTKFLEMLLGLGIDLDLERTTNNEEVFKFKTLQTQEFWPDEAYIKQIANTDKVRRLLDRQVFSKEFYMIIGIKAVTGASAKSKHHAELKLNADVGLDGTVATGGVPISGGVKGGPHIKNTEGVSFVASTDFVFAYRVIKVKIKQGDVEMSESNRGTMFGRGTDTNETPYVLDGFAEMEEQMDWTPVVDDSEQILVA